jgi:AraC family transcriptional regulator of adaptative response/methylated-DNA-[protein]-cysteine methyltransferase
MITDTEMYNALFNKDTSYEGIFIAAVKTTGIFCRPTCTARKPKKENVEFFKNTKEAILHGYRPCKVCNPLVLFGETPEYISDILKDVTSNPSHKFKDCDLRKRGIEPGKIRRWFLKHHGITFHSYQRMFRVNTAFKKIQNGETVSAAAFDTGYESVSGFNDSFKSVFGVTPSNSKDKTVIDISRIETPLGTMYAGGVDDGICLLEFSDRRMLETELKQLAKYFNAAIIQGKNKHFDLLRKELKEYFEHKLKDFTVPLNAPGTVFQKVVWKELRNIPYAKTRSYKEQSEALGNPGAIRHRVIGSDGSLTGYGGGLWRKKWLLEHEGHLPN